MQKERYYIHGDLHESDPDLYYCSACDLFFDEVHFREYHVEANVDLFHSDVRYLGNIMSGGTHHRPDDPVNLFTRES
jgi:hypothetical protein